MSIAPDSESPILFDFADQLLGDVEAGRELPLAHYLARFPGHEEQVAREYLLLTGKAASEIEVGLRRAHPRDTIGPYRLIEILGRGGQGVVYRAEDTRLERTVALKVLSLPLASVSQGRRNRFRREAEIVARLDHPGVCTVLDADLDGDIPYIAMRFVEGETLAAALDRLRDQSSTAGGTAHDSDTSASRLLKPGRALELAETLAFFERVARALHAAHEAGVIHRDVKPGNIMVSKDGLPVVLDFGLARGEFDEQATLTRVDEVFGTPAYLSPEQSVSGRDVDRRTDVYSLGVVLYECLTLTRPFHADSSTELTQAIRAAPVPSLRRANPALPHDLEVVIETAMEKDVARRYATALELAEELRRVREYEPIHARPAGVFLRARRWIQRNPVIATAVIGSVVALLSALVVMIVLLKRVNEEKVSKESALHLYEGGWYRDQAAGLVAYTPPRALRYAIAAAEREPGLASNRALLSALDALYLEQVLVGHEQMVTHVDCAPSSRMLVSTSIDGTARLWDARTGVAMGTVEPHQGELLCAAFSPDSARIVLGGQSGFCSIVSADKPDAAGLELNGHASDINNVQFDPRGTRVVTASRDHSARIFDAGDGRLLARLVGHTGNVSEARFTPDNRHVVTRSAEPTRGSPVSESDLTARVFDAESGAEVCVLRGHSSVVVGFAISPDSRRVVTVSEDRSARQWRIDTGEREPAPEFVFESGGKFHDASFSPDGSRLALCWDAGAKVVDVAAGATVYTLPDHGHRAIARIAFSPDGEQLATIAYDDALRVFRASDGALLRCCRGDSRQMYGLRWSPDGSLLITWARMKTIDVWYGGVRPFLQVLRGHDGAVRTARFDPAGELVLTASADGTARTWSAHTGVHARTFDPRAVGESRTPLISARFDPTGERILTTNEAGRIILWRTRDGTPLTVLGGLHATEIGASFSADGNRVALVDEPGCALIVDLTDGRTRRLRAHQGKLMCMRFTPDGNRILTGGEDRTLALWDATIPPAAPRDSESDTPFWRSEPFEAGLFRLRSVFAVDMSPDGRWVAAGCENKETLLFDARTGELRSSFFTATSGQVQFDSTSQHLVATAKYASGMGLWRIEESPGGVRLARINFPYGAGLQHQNSLSALALSASRGLILTTSLDRSARLWDTERTECRVCYVGHEDAVLDGDITPSGDIVVTASADGTARLWPADLLTTARRYLPEALERQWGRLPVPADTGSEPGPK
ncbi:MAG: protein kinase [Planctomycetes bacterium]|nr:protein kinase [Planctomycetota bacterium]